METLTVAEEAFTQPGAGPDRIAYVIAQLAQRYPKAEYAHLAQLIETAVQEMKERNAS